MSLMMYEYMQISRLTNTIIYMGIKSMKSTYPRKHELILGFDIHIHDVLENKKSIWRVLD
jgi:hypothetical protein